MNNSPTPSPVTIATCPGCNGPCRIFIQRFDKRHVCCESNFKCGYDGPYAETDADAIRLHNAICRPSAGEDVKASPVVPVDKLKELEAEFLAYKPAPTDIKTVEIYREGIGRGLDIAADHIAQLIKEAKGEG